MNDIPLTVHVTRLPDNAGAPQYRAQVNVWPMVVEIRENVSSAYYAALARARNQLNEITDSE